MEASERAAECVEAGPLRLCLVGRGGAAGAAEWSGWVLHALDPQAVLGMAEDQAHALALRAGVFLVDWTEASAGVVPVLRRVLAREAVPLFALCGRDEAEHVAALVVGADAVLTRPLNPVLLQARLLAYHRVRRQSPRAHIEGDPLPVRDASAGTGAAHERYAAGPLVLDRTTRQCFVRGRLLDLTAREFDLMAFLLRHAGACRRRDDILSAVWGIDYDTGTNILDVHIYGLRRKLRAHAVQDLIQTVRGVGYRVAPPAAVQAAW